MFLLDRMRSALAAGCPDPTLPRALASLETLDAIVRDPAFPIADHLVDAYLAAFGDALRYVYVDMLAPFLPTPVQVRSIAPSTTHPSSKLFLFGLFTHSLKICSDRRRATESPAERLFRLLASKATTATARSVLLGVLCFAAYFDDETPLDQLDAALTVGLELDPSHPLFYLTLARHVPRSERTHWARRGLAATDSPLYTLMFQACMDPEAADTEMYERCVRPWVPAFVDRAVLRPLFRGVAHAVDMPTYTEAFTCDVCGCFALHLYRGVCSKACLRRRRQPRKANWEGPCAALHLAVKAHACETCGGRQRACYCAALSNSVTL